MFFSLKDSSKSKSGSRKKYANEIVAMENEMKEAQEKKEEMKKEKESLFVSSRRTLVLDRFDTRPVLNGSFKTGRFESSTNDAYD
jgi:hypothetical protein